MVIRLGPGKREVTDRMPGNLEAVMNRVRCLKRDPDVPPGNSRGVTPTIRVGARGVNDLGAAVVVELVITQMEARGVAPTPAEGGAGDEKSFIYSHVHLKLNPGTYGFE